MCNPRKITARATRQIAEAWRTAVQRTARASGSATGRASLTQRLGSMLGEPARQAFEQAIAADPRWQLTGEAYALNVPGGQVRYLPGTGELDISVELSAYVEAEGSASRVLEGTVEETVEVSAEARYYDDGYGGRTRSRAQQEAQALADEKADKKAQEGTAKARRKAERKAEAALAADSAGVAAEAERDAEARLAAERERRGEELNREAETVLERVQRESMRGVWETVALGYQNLLVAYARANGGRDIAVTSSGGSMQVQFQMEA
jgi:FtsH ternary system domain X2